MTKYFTSIASLLLIVFCGFLSCQKDRDIQAPTGSISGTICPAGAASVIRATNLQSNKVYSTVANALTGIFTIDNVDKGSYKLSFTSSAKFSAPADITITVAAGKNTDVGSIGFQSLSITGTVSPAGAVNYISVSTQDGTPYYVELDTATGAFKTAILPPGNYYVSFATATGYLAPSSVKVTLAAGQSVDVGTINILPHSFSGAPFLLGTPIFSATYSAPDFTITLSQVELGFYKNFKIIMDNITAPGSYECENTATSNITYLKREQYNTFPGLTWNTINTSGSGSVVVTSVDTVKRVIIGTFTATLANSQYPLYSNIVIANGSFAFGY